MLVKSFILNEYNINTITSLCSYDTIAVIQVEHKLEELIVQAIHKILIEKKPAVKEVNNISLYMNSISENVIYRQKVIEFVEYIQNYLAEAISYAVSFNSVINYILAQSVNLCALAVASSNQTEMIDGREMIVCSEDNNNTIKYDWNETNMIIRRKCHNKSHLVISGGYARTLEGSVVKLSRGGADLMASIVASVINAEALEIYNDEINICFNKNMTYEEAAHQCSSTQLPLPSALLWPVKQNNIPIYLKCLQNDNKNTIVISSTTETIDISGIVTDYNLHLVTIYGTGLLGQVGASSSIFSALSTAGVNIRFISQTTSEYAISFAVNKDDSELVSNIIGNLLAKNSLIPLNDVMIINREVATITVYGSRMKNVPGISGKIFSLLGKESINVIASAQGGEELSITIVMDKNDIINAQQILNTLCK